MPLTPAVAASLSAFAGGTVVIVGGTSGIGQAIGLLIAKHAASPARIVLVGRNRAAALSSFDAMRSSTTVTHEYAFEECDMSEFKSVRGLTARLTEKLGKVNRLVLTCGYMTIKGRDANAAGVDKKMAVHLYSRMLVLQDLLPLLEKGAHDAPNGARVLTVLDSKYTPGALDYGDLDLKRAFSLASCARHTTTMNNVMVQAYGAQHPSMSFAHAYPGAVKTNIFHSYPWPLRTAADVLGSLLLTSSERCGEYMLKPLFEERYATGAWLVDNKGEQLKRQGGEQGAEAQRKVFEHVGEVVAR